MRSVLGQDYPNLEYMVLDGGSKDGSLEVIKKYSNRLAYWRSGPDDGGYAAVNEGMAHATGDVFSWLNSDDIYLPRALRTVGEVFAACPEVGMLTTRMPAHLNAYGHIWVSRLAGVSRESLLAERHMPPNKATSIGFVQQESTFVRADCWRAVRGLRVESGLAADYDLWLRLSLRTQPVVIDRVMGAFREHDYNLSKLNASNYAASAKRALELARCEFGWHQRSPRMFLDPLPGAMRQVLRHRFGFLGLAVRFSERQSNIKYALENYRFL